MREVYTFPDRASAAGTRPGAATGPPDGRFPMFKFLFRRSPQPNVPQLLQQALDLHRQGRLADAQASLRAILEAQPDHFEALHLLGVVVAQHGRQDEAEAAFARARRCDPRSVAAAYNHGITLQSLGRNAEALASFDAAIALKPEFAEALSGHGNALLTLGRPEEAAASYAKALAIRPDDVEVLANLGQALLALGRVSESLSAYDRALAIRRDIPVLLNSRANALLRQGRHGEALADYDEAAALDAGCLDASLNRANALHMLGRSDEAIAAYDGILVSAPDHAGASYNRGVVLHAVGRRDEAIIAFERTLTVEPGHANALHNLGIVLGEQNRFDEAAACCERLLAIDPDYPHAAGNLAHMKAHLCDWADRDRLVLCVEEGVRLAKHRCLPFIFMTLSEDSAAQLACAASHTAERHPPDPNPLWTGERYRHDRIRVAYLSADFRDHAVAFLIAGLFEEHDRCRIELTGISFGGGAKTPMRARIEAACERFIDVRGKSDAAIAAIIRALEVDVAVDLMGYTGNARPGILARRPAPVQVNYLGYPGTMGADYIDYILADRFVIPEDKRAHYAEKVVLLPDTFQVNDAKRGIGVQAASREAAGLPPQGFVFCCFNNSYKLTPAMFDIWMRLLRQVPGSVLWLVAGSPAVEANLRREAASRHIDPARLVFAPRVPYAEYLARYPLADLFLDTLPFNAGTTASDALWAGLRAPSPSTRRWHCASQPTTQCSLWRGRGST